MPRNRIIHHDRHRYHDGSLHHGILNWLIGFAVLLCLFNAWTTPPPSLAKGADGGSTDGVDTADSWTTSGSSSSSSNNNNNIEEAATADRYQQQQLSTDAVRDTPVYTSTGAGGVDDGAAAHRGTTLILQQPPPPPAIATATNIEGQLPLGLLPMHTMPDGRKVFLLSPSYQPQQPYPGDPATAAGGGDTPADARVMMMNGPQHSKTVDHTSRRRRDPAKYRHDASPTSYYRAAPPRGGPLPASASTSSSAPEAGPAGFPMPSAVAVRWALCMMAVTGSVLGGGLLAKRALDRIDRWEQLSKEDSLAFDIAYTSPYTAGEGAGGLAGGPAGFLYPRSTSTSSNNDGTGSEASYGSFSSTADWRGDRLNRFDV
jgi:hypothetical protein